MSVLNLTISYVKPCISVAREATATVARASFVENMTLKTRKRIFKTGMLFFVILVVAYLLLVGSAVSKTFQKALLIKELGGASAFGKSAEEALIREEYAKDLAFFQSQGFEQMKNLNIIKRTDNVAESISARTQYP